MNRELLQMVEKNTMQLSVLANATQTTDAKVSHLMIESSSTEYSPKGARKRTRLEYPINSTDMDDPQSSSSSIAILENAAILSDTTPKVKIASMFSTSSESRRKVVDLFNSQSLEMKGMSIESMLLLYFKHDLEHDINWANPVNQTIKRDMRRVAKEALRIATEEQKNVLQKPNPDAFRTPDLFRTHEERVQTVLNDLKTAIMDKVKAYKTAIMTHESGPCASRAIPATKPFVAAVATILLKAEKLKLLNI